MATGSDMHHFALVARNLSEENQLYTFMVSLMAVNALAANLGMQVIKDENAVFKQSMMLLPIPILWIFHMNYGQQKDSFSVAKLLGQVLLVGCIFAFMWADRVAVAEEEASKAYKKKLKNNPNGLPDDEEGHLILREPAQDETELPAFVAAKRRTRFDEKQLMSEGTSSQPEHSDEFESSPERITKVD